MCINAIAHTVVTYQQKLFNYICRLIYANIFQIASFKQYRGYSCIMTFFKYCIDILNYQALALAINITDGCGLSNKALH